MNYIINNSIPVLAEYDVVVCGGGPAGCAAAIESARCGVNTLLIEKYGYLGGATVAQLVAVILSTNGMDFQGIWHEWASRLLKYESIAPLIRSQVAMYPGREWLRSSVSPEGVKRVWNELVSESGADILLMAHFCGSCVEDGVITGVAVHTRAGLQIVRAKRVVDATGDAVVCHDAGVLWDRGVVGKPWPQAVSLVRRWGGYAAVGTAEGPVPGAPGTLAKLPERLGRTDRKFVDPLDPFAVSNAIRDMQQEIWLQSDSFTDGHYLVESAAELGVRISRIVHGIDRITDDEAWNLRKSPTGIARSSWEFDIHPPDDEYPLPERWFHSKSEANIAHNKKIAAGDYFDIPYGCLVASGIDNLLVAGRCISAGYLAQGSLRIQQTCMSTGQAAGATAALSLKNNVTPREMNPSIIVSHLMKARDVEPVFDILRNI
ncbi:MAG: FAD-dependent oxidoreductase [bacterium]